MSEKRESRLPSSKTCGQRNVSERSLRPASPTRDRATATVKLTIGSSQPRGSDAGRGTPRRQSPSTISPAGPAGAGAARPSWRPRAHRRSLQSDCHLHRRRAVQFGARRARLEGSRSSRRWAGNSSLSVAAFRLLASPYPTVVDACMRSYALRPRRGRRKHLGCSPATRTGTYARRNCDRLCLWVMSMALVAVGASGAYAKRHRIGSSNGLDIARCTLLRWRAAGATAAYHSVGGGEQHRQDYVPRLLRCAPSDALPNRRVGRIAGFQSRALHHGLFPRHRTVTS